MFNDCRNLFHVISNGGQLAGEQRRRLEHQRQTQPIARMADACGHPATKNMSPSLAANFKLKSGVHTLYKNDKIHF
jgi:hypothetical protein